MNGNFIYNKFIYFLAGFVPVQLVISASASAQGPGPPINPSTGPGVCGGTTVGSVLCNVVKNSQDVPGLFAGLSYLFGIFIGVWGLAKLYSHVNNPAQTSIWEGLQRFLAAGGLFALPWVMDAARNALTGNVAGLGTSTAAGWTGSTTGAGLDAMVVALMSDVFSPMARLLMGFCYLAGIILVMIGIIRLMKSAQEGARGPGGFGTIMTFLVAGALLSADEMMGAFETSLFGGAQLKTSAALTFNAGLLKVEENHILSIISAVLAFVMVLGWISFIRGWFIIRDVAEGNQQASLMAGLTHLFGGALAINLGGLLNAVQATFGLSAIGVNFS